MKHVNPRDDPHSAASEVVAFLARLSRMPPLDLLAEFFLRRSDLADVARDLFEAYDQFLSVLNDPEKRQHLDKLTADQVREDETYGIVRGVSHRFRDALETVFISERSGELLPLTQRYGVFWVRAIGFSTGALAKGNTQLALEMLRAVDVDAVELSALRLHELAPLIHYLGSRALTSFAFVSIHAPSAFPPSEEKWLVRTLGGLAERGWPIVLHPDAIAVPRYWQALGSALLIENMDKRKPIGRTADELRLIFAQLPEARLCFDLAHARQVDSSMTEAYLIVQQFRHRMAQLHVSDVSTSSRHSRLSPTSIASFAALVPLMPVETPAIIESPVQSPAEMAIELQRARLALSSVFSGRGAEGGRLSAT
jgi:hypothetical protein